MMIHHNHRKNDIDCGGVQILNLSDLLRVLVNNLKSECFIFNKELGMKVFEEKCVMLNLVSPLKIDTSDVHEENGLQILYNSHVEVDIFKKQCTFFRFNNKICWNIAIALSLTLTCCGGDILQVS